MGKKLKKSTKKFSKNHLATEIKNRREHQKIRKKRESQEQVKAEKALLRKKKDQVKEQHKLDDAPAEAGLGDVADLDVDEFLKADFLDSDDDAGGDEDMGSLESDAEDEEAEPAKTKAPAAKSADKQKKPASKEASKKATAESKKKPTKKSSEDSESEESSDEEEDDGVDLIEKHKRELEELAKVDPEFHKHLMQSGSQLLEFGSQADEEEDETLLKNVIERAKSDKSEELDGAAADEESESFDVRDLVLSSLNELRKRAVEEKSVGSLKRLLRYFRSACHIYDEAKANAGGKRKGGRKGEEEEAADHTKITSGKVFNRLMQICLSELPSVFTSHLTDSAAPAESKQPKAAPQKGAKPAKRKSPSSAMDLDDEDAEDKPAADESAEDARAHELSTSASAARQMKNHKNWSRMEPLLKSYLGNLLHYFGHVVDAEMIRFLVNAAKDIVPFFIHFVKLAAKFLKHLVRIWAMSPAGADAVVADSQKSDSSKWDELSKKPKKGKKQKSGDAKKAKSGDDEDEEAEDEEDGAEKKEAAEQEDSDSDQEDEKSGKVAVDPNTINLEEQTRVMAFLRVRELCLLIPPEKGILEIALKEMYLAYVRNSKFVSTTTLPHIRLMANCVVEIYGLDPTTAYQYAFVYIRQLAIHLRSAITQKTKESHRSVYNWQYVNSLRVWAKVLAAHGADKAKPLAQLVYPFVQVCTGVLGLLPVSRYFPLRFHVIRFLNDLASATALYIPLGPHLLSVFEANDMKKPTKYSTAKPPIFSNILKASKTMLTTRAYQTAAVQETLRLMLEHFALYSDAICFPELVLPIKVFLKKFSKETAAQVSRKQITTFLEKLERNVQYVTAKRNKVEFSPKDMVAKGISPITTFAAAAAANTDPKKAVSPLNQFVQMQGKEEEKLAQETEQSRKRSRAREEEDEEDEEDAEVEEEEEAEEEEARPSPLKKSKKGGKSSGKASTPADFAGANDEDVVDDLVLSEEDEE